MPRPIRPATARAIGQGSINATPITTHLDRDDRLALIYRDPRWRRLRTVLLSAWPTCCRCGQARANTADHINSAQANLHQAFSIDAVQQLCTACNKWKTNTYDQVGARLQPTTTASPDFRSQQQKAWAEHLIASGQQLHLIGHPAAGGSKAMKGKQWAGDLTC